MVEEFYSKYENDYQQKTGSIQFTLDTLDQIKKKDVINRQKQLLLQINSHKERAKKTVSEVNQKIEPETKLEATFGKSNTITRNQNLTNKNQKQKAFLSKLKNATDNDEESLKYAYNFQGELKKFLEAKY